MKHHKKHVVKSPKRKDEGDATTLSTCTAENAKEALDIERNVGEIFLPRRPVSVNISVGLTFPSSLKYDRLFRGHAAWNCAPCN